MSATTGAVVGMMIQQHRKKCEELVAAGVQTPEYRECVQYLAPHQPDDWIVGLTCLGVVLIIVVGLPLLMCFISRRK